MDYSHLADIADIATIPDDGILSRTIYNDKHSKVVLFSFAEGEELSEHTSSMPVEIQIILGEARMTLDHETVHAETGARFSLPMCLPHSIYAKTPLVMLLLMHKEA